VSRSTAPYGMLLDRGLTLEQLDLAYDIAVADPDPKTNRRRLTVALRDVVSDQEAEGKTKKCLTRVWLNPPPEAERMIRWARHAAVPRPARPILHFGALLATFPFVGAVSRVIGQHLQTEGSVEGTTVRAEVRRSLGDRSAVDVAARKSYTCLRNLGIIEQQGRTLLPLSYVLEVPAELVGWMTHAILMTRSADSLPVSSLVNAPELLGLKLDGKVPRAYEALEVHGQPPTSVVALAEATS
jgi:hypothetical protein